MLINGLYAECCSLPPEIQSVWIFLESPMLHFIRGSLHDGSYWTGFRTTQAFSIFENPSAGSVMVRQMAF